MSIINAETLKVNRVDQEYMHRLLYSLGLHKHITNNIHSPSTVRLHCQCVFCDWCEWAWATHLLTTSTITKKETNHFTRINNISLNYLARSTSSLTEKLKWTVNYKRIRRIRDRNSPFLCLIVRVIDGRHVSCPDYSPIPLLSMTSLCAQSNSPF